MTDGQVALYARVSSDQQADANTKACSSVVNAAMRIVDAPMMHAMRITVVQAR
jgi:hypothetical protein